MPIDPREHDPNELRRAIEAADDDVLRVFRKRMAEQSRSDDAVLRAAQLKQLLLLESSAPTDALERPYLESIPGKYAAEITLFEWLDFLLGRGGVKRTLEVIDYYESTGWLGSHAADELRNHTRGFEDPGVDDPVEFGMADHVLSLVYVARLSAMAQ